MLLRISLTFLCFLFFAACSTPRKGIWTHSAGGSALRTEKEKDTAQVQTKLGKITLHPVQSDVVGTKIEVTIHNTTSNTATFDLNWIQAQNTDGAITDPMPESMVKTAIGANSNFVNAALASNYATTQAVASKMEGDILPTLLRSGTIPPASSKKGFIYFDNNALSPSTLIIRLAEPLAPTADRITFSVKN